MPHLILLIEDSPQIAKSIQLSLQPEGYHVTVAPDLASARKFAPYSGFELALVDVMLPDGSGLDFCAELRIACPNLPQIVITAKADEDSVVAGLSVAQDYVRKPFGKRELLARIQKCLQQKVKAAKSLEYEGMRLRSEDHSVQVGPAVAKLRPKEFTVLSLLVLHGGETVPRERILQHVDQENEMNDRSLDSHVSRIRKALQLAGITEFELTASPSRGYHLAKKKAA